MQITPWLAGQQAMWQIWRWQIIRRVFACYYIAKEQADKAFALVLSLEWQQIMCCPSLNVLGI